MPQPRTGNPRRVQTEEERSQRLEAMFRDYAPRILDYARHRGATLVEAEDVVSEVFIVVTRRLDDAPPQILPWLYGVARKVQANQVRGNRRRLALEKRVKEQVMWTRPGGGPHTSTVSNRDELVRRGLEMLPARDREAVLLVAWEGLSYEEAATSLGCTRMAFAKLLSRARRRLASHIDDIRTYEDSEWRLGESESDAP
jgi:RNA polymerase sigma factor (sigma-70 family)